MSRKPRLGCGTGCGCAGIGCSIPLLAALLAAVGGVRAARKRRSR